MPNSWTGTIHACPECPGYLMQTLDGQHWVCVTRQPHGVFVLRGGQQIKVEVEIDPELMGLGPESSDPMTGALRAIIKAYLAHPQKTDPFELERQLTVFTRSISHASEQARHIYGRTRTLLSELAYHHRSKTSFDAALFQLLRTITTP